jgi:hypothetical protein
VIIVSLKSLTIPLPNLRVKKNAVLLDIYAERSSTLESTLELAKRLQPIVLSKKPEERMLLDRVPEKIAVEKPFMLER